MLSDPLPLPPTPLRQVLYLLVRSCYHHGLHVSRKGHLARFPLRSGSVGPDGQMWPRFRVGAYISQSGVIAQRPNGPPYGLCRILIPWAKIRALLVPNWTHHAAVDVSRVSLCALFDFFSDHRRMLSVSYDYPPISGTQYYLPPRTDYPDDLRCDCNTVMYKCEVRIP